MKTRFKRFAFLLALSLLALDAIAQNNRSFVATTGSDANNCTPGLECRSFNRAIAMTNPGGEIIAINSGGYGAFSVSKAITIVGAPGIVASITVSGVDGIDIIAGASDRVVVRGLNITQSSGGHAGIYATSFGSLAIENCVVTGGTYGVFIGASGSSLATLTNDVVRAATGEAYHVAGNTTLIRSRSEGIASGIGLAAFAVGNPLFVTAVDFVSAGSSYGVYGNNSGPYTLVIVLEHAIVSGNTSHGVFADGSGGGTLRFYVRNSVVTQNTGIGFYQTGASMIYSYGDNAVNGNAGGDTAGTITSASTM